MISAVFNCTLNNLHFSIRETNLCCSLDFKSYSIFTSWWNQIKQSFQNSRAQPEVEQKRGPKISVTLCLCKNKHMLFSLYWLSSSLFIIFIFCSLNSPWSCSPIFISFPLPDSPDFSSASLFFPPAPIVFCLLHMPIPICCCWFLVCF